MQLLRLDGVEQHYGEFLAFRCESLTASAGIIGLLGPNGAGKSTLLKIVLGLLEPTCGQVEVLGHDLATCPRDVRRRVGYMPENDSFVGGLSVLDFVALAGELAGMTRRASLRRSHEVLSYLGLEETRYRSIEEQSTGRKQRAKLAQALVHDPELLILDEPTNGLDPGGRAAMLGLIESLRADHGLSIVLSSHLLSDVDRICDSLIVLDSGEVRAVGPIGALRDAPEDRYLLELEGHVETLSRALESAGLAVEALERAPNGCHRLLVTVAVDRGPRRVLELLAADATGAEAEKVDDSPVLRRLVPWEESLDTVFERLTIREEPDEESALESPAPPSGGVSDPETEESPQDASSPPEQAEEPVLDA